MMGCFMLLIVFIAKKEVDVAASFAKNMRTKGNKRVFQILESEERALSSRLYNVESPSKSKAMEFQSKRSSRPSVTLSVTSLRNARRAIAREKNDRSYYSTRFRPRLD